MPVLTLVLALLVASVTGGSFLTAAFALGLYSWPTVAIASALGLFAAAALAALIDREIKRCDPAWDEGRDRARLMAVVRPRPGTRHDRDRGGRL